MTPIQAIENALEHFGLNRADLVPMIGSRARASEIMNKKRPLTLAMIRRLHNELCIDANVLIQPYRLSK